MTTDFPDSMQSRRRTPCKTIWSAANSSAEGCASGSPVRSRTALMVSACLAEKYAAHESSPKQPRLALHVEDAEAAEAGLRQAAQEPALARARAAADGHHQTLLARTPAQRVNSRFRRSAHLNHSPQKPVAA